MTSISVIGSGRDFAHASPGRASRIFRLVDGEDIDISVAASPATKSIVPKLLTQREYWAVIWSGVTRDEQAEDTILHTAAVAFLSLSPTAGYATDFNDPSSAKTSIPNVAYQGIRDGLAAAFANYVMGNPAATPGAILKLVDSPKPPLRVALGSSAVGDITSVYENRLAT
jgi:hypothetical protein